MTFADIALKTVRRKFGSYLVYFFSTAFAVLLFNLFCSIYYNPTFENYRFGTGKMSVLFRISAIAVFLFALVFVLYAGSYFLKMQKKEIAIYALLGMRKAQIAVMMFLETFSVGLLAVALGTLLGTLSARYAVALLLRFMAEGTDVTFALQPRAIMVTVAAFGGIFLASGLRAYLTIYQNSLIDLLSASRKSEGLPCQSPAEALAAVVLLVIGYGITLLMKLDVGGRQLLRPTLLSGLCIFAGTYLLFRSVVPLVICSVKKRRWFYYRTTNFIGVSQVAFRLKNNARMLTVISLLTAAAITMISASYSFYAVVGGDGTEAYAPFSYLAKNIEPALHDRLLDTVASMGEVHVVSEDRIELIRIGLQNGQYAVKDQQTGEASPGRAAEGYLLSESLYQRIIAVTHTPRGILSETRSNFDGGLADSSCFFIDGNAVGDYCRELPGQPMLVTFHGETAAYQVAGVSLHKYIGALDLYKCPSVVVSDAIYQRLYAAAAPGDIDVFYGFQFDDDMRAGSTVDAIDRFIPARFHLGGLPGNMSYIGVYKANFALFGAYAFIGFFLGTLFLLACGSVLYYKLIMEAQEEAPRYALLRKIGMKEGEAVVAVAKQLGFVYALPLLVGLTHTLFGLLLYNRALGEMSQQTPTLQNAAMVAGLFVLVYGAFYVLSTVSCRRIVWQQTTPRR